MYMKWLLDATAPGIEKIHFLYISEILLADLGLGSKAFWGGAECYTGVVIQSFGSVHN